MYQVYDPAKYANVGLVFFLFAIFCAYWAQTTNRSAWLWFVLGLDLRSFDRAGAPLQEQPGSPGESRLTVA
jgi:hypothetical protein